MKNRRSFLVYPYVFWSILFIVIPLIIVLFFSITIEDNSKYIFSFENFTRLLNPQYGKIIGRSLKLAFVSTVLCLILGYPVAYLISRMPIKRRNIFIMLFILPMWMNFLLRTYAWLPILGKTGIVNTFLGHFNIEPISFLYNDGAVLLGMVYNFIPFMILPIYTVLTKMNQDLVNAAKDLGANDIYIFRKITFPLSLPGVLSGITMVFMPAVSTFVISNLLGGGQYMLVGNLIETQFTTMANWNFGSAISIIMMIIILLSILILNKYSGKSAKEGGSGLW